MERGRGPAPEWGTPAARVIAGLRPLHLQHIRTEQCQNEAGVGSGDVIGKFDDLHTGQRQHVYPSKAAFRPAIALSAAREAWLALLQKVANPFAEIFAVEAVLLLA